MPLDSIMTGYGQEHHDMAVQELAQEVGNFYDEGIPYRINHGSTNSTRRRSPNTPQLNIAHLNHIVSIDQADFSALVEPNVPLDALVRERSPSGSCLQLLWNSRA